MVLMLSLWLHVWAPENHTFGAYSLFALTLNASEHGSDAQLHNNVLIFFVPHLKTHPRMNPDKITADNLWELRYCV